MSNRPRVSFDSGNIWRRLEICGIVARSCGWYPEEIAKFDKEVSDAFSYEEAMAIINREFEVVAR